MFVPNFKNRIEASDEAIKFRFHGLLFYNCINVKDHIQQIYLGLDELEREEATLEYLL